MGKESLAGDGQGGGGGDLAAGQAVPGKKTLVDSHAAAARPPAAGDVHASPAAATAPASKPGTPDAGTRAESSRELMDLASGGRGRGHALHRPRFHYDDAYVRQSAAELLVAIHDSNGPVVDWWATSETPDYTSENWKSFFAVLGGDAGPVLAYLDKRGAKELVARLRSYVPAASADSAKPAVAASAQHGDAPKPAVAASAQHGDAPKPDAASAQHRDAPKPDAASAQHGDAPKPAVAASAQHGDAPKPDAASAQHGDAPSASHAEAPKPADKKPAVSKPADAASSKPAAAASAAHAPAKPATPAAAAKPPVPAAKPQPYTPFEGNAPGIKASDALNVAHAARNARVQSLAAALVAGSLEAAAMAAEGSPIGKDDKLRAALVAEYTTAKNADIDEQNAMEEEAYGIPRDQNTPHVKYTKHDVATIESIIDESLGQGSLKAGYLKQILQDGASSPLWRVRLALGLLWNAPAQDEEVMHLVLDAPPRLAQFGLTWQSFWDALKAPLAKKLTHWNHHSLIRRLQAFSAVQLAEADLHAADDKADVKRDELKKAQAAAAKDPKSGADKWATIHLASAEKAVKDKTGALADKKIEYLVALIVNIRDELDDLEPDAVAEISEWTHENSDLRARASTDPRVIAALTTHLKKPRDVDYVKRVLAGDADKKVGGDLKKRGFADGEVPIDEVIASEAMIDREQAKKKLGRGKKHTNLKATLLSMSPDARDALLARIADVSKADLAKNRDAALATLVTKLIAVGLSKQDAEEIGGMYRFEESGASYAKLHALVAASDKKTKESADFGKRALALIVELRGDEFAQVRADAPVLDAVTSNDCTEHVKIREVLGIIGKATPLPALTEHAIEQATDDAELTTAHWSALLDQELGQSWVRRKQSRNKVYLIAHRAQQAAARKDARDKTQASAAFMKAVYQGLTQRSWFDTFYPSLSTELKTGKPVTVDDVMDEVLYHDGPLRVFGKDNPAFYTHVNQDDFVKTVLETNGAELLDGWSNLTDFKTGLSEAQKVDAAGAGASQDGAADPKRNERAFRHQFVLDVRDDRKQLIKKAVGNSAAPGVLKQLRMGLRKAAENDAQFKQPLEAAGINSEFHRDRMEMRSALEAAQQRREGWQMHGVSSKGTADAQNQRQMTGDLRRADADIQKAPVQVDAAGHEDEAARRKEQDDVYKRDHQKELAGDQAALDRSGASFQALRQKIRQVVELSITIAVMVIATAIALGITGATFGGASPTLVGVAMIWAKFGVMVAAKLAAAGATALIKEAAGNAITGEEWDGRRVATGAMVQGAGAAFGGLAGAGVDAAISVASGMSNAAANEVFNVLASAGAKAMSQQGMKKILEQREGDVTIKNTLIAVGLTEVTSIAAGEIAVAFSGEQAVNDAKLHKDDDEAAKAIYEDAEAYAREMAYLSKNVDYALEQTFDYGGDKGVDGIEERMAKAAELREKKLEAAEERSEHAVHAKHAAHAAHAAAHGAHGGAAAHGAAAHGAAAHGAAAHGGATQAAAGHQPAQPAHAATATPKPAATTTAAATQPADPHAAVSAAAPKPAAAPPATPAAAKAAEIKPAAPAAAKADDAKPHDAKPAAPAAATSATPAAAKAAEAEPAGKKPAVATAADHSAAAKPTGVVRIGNTCYLIASLNTLAKTPAYRALFRVQRAGPTEALRLLIDPVLAEIEAGTQVGSGEVAAIIDALDQMGKLPPPDARDHAHTAKTAQQDASEILRRLLEMFPAQDSAQLGLSQVTSTDFSKTALTAVADGKADRYSALPADRTLNEAAAPGLILDLPIEDIANLEAALQAYQAAEPVTARAVDAGKVVEGTASRRSTLRGTPSVITIALKRFSMGARGPVADNHAVEMPETFPLNGVRYKLQAVILQTGEATSGHYTSVTHEPEGYAARNDTAVGPEQDPEARRKHGYIYTYVRQG